MLDLLIYVLIVLCIVGVLFYVTSLIPAPPPIKIAMQVVCGIIAVLLLLGILGVFPGMRVGHLPR